MRFLKPLIVLFFGLVFFAASPARAQIVITEPADGSTISGTNPVTFTVSLGTAKPGRVEFYVDGAGQAVCSVDPTGNIATCSGTFAWVAGQTHKITAKVYRKQDLNNPISTIGPITVTVKPPLPPPITVTITSPKNGSTIINPGMTLTAATKSPQVARVDYFIGTKRLCTSSAAPKFACDGKYPWADGKSYTITLKAYDKSGKLLTIKTAPVSVTVRLPVEPIAVTITSPKNGSAVIDPGMKLTAATKSPKVARVDYFIGTTKLCSGTAPAFACAGKYPWADGKSYTITLKAHGKDGKLLKVETAPVKVTVHLTVPFFRLFKQGQVDHFYTTAAPERDNAIKKLGYKGENVCCRIFKTQAPGTVPLYRAFKPGVVNHFYTTNKAEWENAKSKLGYQGENVAGYIYPKQHPGTVPLYRAFKPGAVDHFYTTNKAEWENAKSKLGYQGESIAGYVYPR